MAKFSDDDNVKFVELYSQHECLWNTSAPSYKNRDARDSALKNIAEEMGKLEFTTTKDVTNKIKNLRSTYYQEMKKIESSIKSGAGTEDVYKPRVPWFKILHSCIKHHVVKRSGESNLSINTNEGKTEHDALPEYSGEDGMQISTETVGSEEDGEGTANNCATGRPSSENNTAPILITIPADNSSRKPAITMHQPETKNQSKPVIGIQRRKQHKLTNDSISKAIDKLDNIATRATQQIAPKSNPDEFESFGSYVAANLRKLPPAMAAEAEMSIHQILHATKMKALRPQQTQLSAHNRLERVSSPEDNQLDENSVNTTFLDSTSCDTDESLGLLNEFIYFNPK